MNDFLPTFLSEIFVFEEEEQSSAYTTGDVSTTVIYVIQLAFTLICFYAIYKKVAKTIDWKKRWRNGDGKSLSCKPDRRSH